MGHWLNANATGIQAIGSIATVLVTCVLAFITWRYVRLTQSLVSAQLGEAAARRRVLRTEIGLISGFLRELLPPDDPRLPAALASYFGDLRDLSGSRFRALAAEVSGEAGDQATAVEEHGTWLINLVRDIRARGERYDWSSFPRTEYEARRRSGLDAFNRLLAEIDSQERARRV